mmetsp:Transcript_50282/g.129443  ORF Transcript_50282/g.129443 Transcript_50282/m.129443 type:complete len:304 (-) Transcript_50282:2514-3425(-)
MRRRDLDKYFSDLSKAEKDALRHAVAYFQQDAFGPVASTAETLRWSDSACPLEEDADLDPLRAFSPFPYSPALNEIICTWRGDIWNLEIDAMALPTNKTFSLRNEMLATIHLLAGNELSEEQRLLEECRTGEAKMTRGYRLPAKNVIHTVDPVFKPHYKTAAENGLHQCYRNCLAVLCENGLKEIALPILYTAEKKYPREDAAHIALRTIRRFLERYPDKCDRVILVLKADGDNAIYEKLLPAYFPRSKTEEKWALGQLPKDTGNELGETVIKERAITIGVTPLDTAKKGSGAGPQAPSWFIK